MISGNFISKVQSSYLVLDYAIIYCGWRENELYLNYFRNKNESFGILKLHLRFVEKSNQPFSLITKYSCSCELRGDQGRSLLTKSYPLHLFQRKIPISRTLCYKKK